MEAVATWMAEHVPELKRLENELAILEDELDSIAAKGQIPGDYGVNLDAEDDLYGEEKQDHDNQVKGMQDRRAELVERIDNLKHSISVSQPEPEGSSAMDEKAEAASVINADSFRLFIHGGMTLRLGLGCS